MKKSGYYIELISEKGIKILAIIILAWLTYWQAVSTFRLPFDYIQEYLFEYEDSPLKNLLFLIGFLLLTFVIQKLVLRGESTHQRKKVFIFAIVDIIVVGILLATWVSICNIPPYWDQLEVLNIATAFRGGDYSHMDNLYIQMYTQHYGLIFFEELFLGIWNDYRIFQYLNVIFIMLIIFFFYLITDLLFDKPAISLYCLMGITAFLPMHIYVVYVYGDLGSIALCMTAMWGLLKWIRTEQVRYLSLCIIVASIAVLIRQNSLVMLIAFLIATVIHGWKMHKMKPLLAGLLVLFIPLLCVQLIEGYYEIRSGREISQGLPSTVWFSMGLQEDWGGVGVDTAYDESLWWHCDSDPQATSEAAMKDIEARIKELQNNPEHAKELFRYKALEQWIEPTFTSLTMTGKFETPANIIVEKLYFGSIPDYICRFMNYFLFVIYTGSLFYTIVSLRRKDGILHSIMHIIFVGGFLFGMIWEAKGRYMMPYAMILIPYMACGLSQLQEYFGLLCKKIRSKIKTTK